MPEPDACRLDLHTHSVASPDGSLKPNDYRQMLQSGGLQVVAVTDHNRIDFAQKLHAELGEGVIVGEEITAQEGELIGLYLKVTIPSGLTAQETARRIHTQGGLVYIPHPFETARKGLPLHVLNQLAGQIDIVETHNGRTLQNKGGQAQKWTAEHHIPGASSSDAHGRRGWGNTYSLLTRRPTRGTLITLLKEAEHSTKSVGSFGRLYPKLNRMRKHRV